MAVPPDTDAKGWRVIPDLTALRAKFQNEMGRQAGWYAAERISAAGWRVVFDLRQDGLSDGFICERKKPDGSVASVAWDAKFIRAFYPPMIQNK